MVEIKFWVGEFVMQALSTLWNFKSTHALKEIR